MTRKSFILRLAVIAIALSMFLLTAFASEPLEASVWEPDGEFQTIYVTWQYPIPSSEKGDKLNMSVGVLVDGKTYVSQEVFDLLGIPKCPECPHCKGITITVDGETDTYYPLRENAEQFGYSVLWAPDAEEDGKVVDHRVYIARKDVGTNWIRTVYKNDQDADYKIYLHFYAYQEGDCWCIDWGDETERIPEENVTVMEQ